MARIDPAQQQLASRPLPTPYDDTRVSAESQGAAIGAGIEQLGGALGEIGRQAKIRADQTAVIDAQGKAQNALNAIILDPAKGYRSLKGEDAVAKRNDTFKAFDEALNAIAGGLSNDDQQREFKRHIIAFRESGLRNILHHEEVEGVRAATAKYDGAQEAALQTLGLVATDPKQRDDTLKAIADRAILQAKAQFGQGASKEQVAAVFLPAMTKAAEATMAGAMASSDPGAARAAFTRVGDLLTPNRRAFFTQTIDRLDADQKISAATTQLVAGSLGKNGIQVDPTKYAQAAAALDPADPLSADIIRGGNAQVAQRDQVWSHKVGGVLNRVMTAAQAGGATFDLSKASSADKAYLVQYAPDEYLKLRGKELRDANSETPEERTAYAAFLLDFGRSPRSYASRTDEQLMREVFVNLSTGGMQRAAETIKSERLRQANGLSGNKTFLGATLPKMIQETGMRLLGWPTKLTKSQQISMSYIRDEVASQIGTEEQKKTLDVSDIRTMIESEFKKGDVSNTGRFYDDTVTHGEFLRNPKYAGKDFIPSDSTGAVETRSDAKPGGAPAAPQTFTVLTPKGQRKLVTKDQLDQALKQGWTLVR